MLTAHQMYDHLSELVDDHDFVMRAVRVHYPDFTCQAKALTRLAERDARKSPNKKPRKRYTDEREYEWTAGERLYAKNMEIGSRQLRDAVISELLAMASRQRRNMRNGAA